MAPVGQMTQCALKTPVSCVSTRDSARHKFAQRRVKAYDRTYGISDFLKGMICNGIVYLYSLWMIEEGIVASPWNVP